MSNEPKPNDKKPAPKAGFDRGSQDFFRGSRGPNFFVGAKSNRGQIGMRRGSR